MTINISQQTEMLLREKSEREEQEPDALADSLLQALLLSDAEDYSEACAGIAEGFAQIGRGESIAFDDYVEQSRLRRAQRQSEMS